MQIPHLKIASAGSYVPSEVLPNSFFSSLDLFTYDVSGERIKKDGKELPSERVSNETIIELSGIKERRRSFEPPSYMGFEAAKIALERAGKKADDLVGIICATISEKENVPSAACKISANLGAKNARYTFDINNACAGFPLGLILANELSKQISGDWLVIASEQLTRIVDYTDRNCFLFGDGAGAALLTKSNDQKGIFLGGYSNSDYSGIDLIKIDKRCYLRMGKGVMKRAVNSMIDSAKSLKEDLHWEDPIIYLPHQANIRIINSVSEKVSVGGSIVYFNIEQFGNMSAATCPVALERAMYSKDPTIKEGSKVIITSFGAGLVTSAVAVQF